MALAQSRQDPLPQVKLSEHEVVKTLSLGPRKSRIPGRASRSAHRFDIPTAPSKILFVP